MAPAESAAPLAEAPAAPTGQAPQNAVATLPPGEHTYAITYRTDRSIGYFADHDELYLNVTRNNFV